MKKTTFYKTAIAVCLAIMSMSLSSCCTQPTTEYYYQESSMQPITDTTITAKVTRVGRYLLKTDHNCNESGTVLIFENGDIFKNRDYNYIETSFACAVKEGDVVSYVKTTKGEIILKSFVSPADDKQGAQ